MTSIETLRALHHPTRRRIVDYLHLYDVSKVGVLARDLGQQVGSISHHLRILERAGVVVRAPEMAADGRTSWWRLVTSSFTWSVDDFADSPADRAEAKAVERANIEDHFARLRGWKIGSEQAPEEWRRASFSTDMLAMATPGEVEALQEELLQTLRAWRGRIDATDGAERRPVFVLAHGFPSRP